MKILNIKSLASSVVIAFCSLAASATSAHPGRATGPTFADVELGSFTLTGASSAAGAPDFAPYIWGEPSFQIVLPQLSFDPITKYHAVQALTTRGVLTGEHFPFSGLVAGNHCLRINGPAGGANLFGGQCMVTPVPEPETWLMLLVGLGILGCAARRRVFR